MISFIICGKLFKSTSVRYIKKDFLTTKRAHWQFCGVERLFYSMFKHIYERLPKQSSKYPPSNMIACSTSTNTTSGTATAAAFLSLLQDSSAQSIIPVAHVVPQKSTSSPSVPFGELSASIFENFSANLTARLSDLSTLKEQLEEECTVLHDCQALNELPVFAKLHVLDELQKLDGLQIKEHEESQLKAAQDLPKSILRKDSRYSSPDSSDNEPLLSRAQMTGKSLRVSFKNQSPQVCSTYSPNLYDRSHMNDCTLIRVFSPSVKDPLILNERMAIIKEFNTYKQTEMLVHPEARKFTTIWKVQQQQR